MSGVVGLAALAALAGLATWLTLRYARHRLVDEPGERRSHTVPTPRGGGLGIVVALLAAVAVAAWQSMYPTPMLAGFAAGLLLVAGIGWIDDHRPLSPWLRLGVQGLAGIVLAAGFHFTGLPWPAVLLALVAVPVLVNVWNFMDGINGLAASQAAIAAAGLALLAAPALAPACLALAAACTGFLPFNFPRARIFLGDVGSGALGFVLAALAVPVAMGMRDVGHSLLVLLPLSAFLVDASLTLVRRMLAGERWWLPHVTHLYQVWVRAGRTHAFVTSVYGTFSITAVIVSLQLHGIEPRPAAGGALGWLAVSGLGWLVLRRLVQRPP